jgi:hypothetical protein
MATDKKKVNYILIDVNANGSYADPGDKIFFNTWNPYDKKSEYMAMKNVRGNKWYNVDYLDNTMFLSLNVDLAGKRLKLDNENSQYNKSKEKGKLVVDKMLSNCVVTVDGTDYTKKVKNRRAELKLGLGKHLLEISREGYLPFEKTFSIDKQNPILEVGYVATPAAIKVEIIDIDSEDFIVTIKNDTGYEKSYLNKTAIYVPIGKSTVDIDDNGAVTTIEIEAKKGKPIKIDYATEQKKRFGIGAEPAKK